MLLYYNVSGHWFALPDRFFFLVESGNVYPRLVRNLAIGFLLSCPATKYTVKTKKHKIVKFHYL